MGIVQKLVSGSEERRSRLHDRRGTLAPLTEWARIPALLLERRRAPRRSPWMARGAIDRLNDCLTNEMSLLELGSGASTGWYADRVAQVVSLEPNRMWAESTQELLKSYLNIELQVGSIGTLAPRILRENKVDVVVVDHTDEPDFSRIDALRLLGSRVSIAVLDDSDRKQYAETATVMAGWNAKRFVSFRPNPMVATETTVFWR